MTLVPAGVGAQVWVPQGRRTLMPPGVRPPARPVCKSCLMTDHLKPEVRIVHLTGPVFHALARGDLAAANAVSPVPVSVYFAGPDWRGVWQMRGRQVDEDPASAAWVTGVIWDELRQVAVGRAGY